MVFGETLTYTNTVRGALVSYKQRDMGAGGRGTHIWHVPLAESAEAAQRVLQPPRAAGAARREFANPRALCSIASVIARAGVPFFSIHSIKLHSGRHCLRHTTANRRETQFRAEPTPGRFLRADPRSIFCLSLLVDLRSFFNNFFSCVALRSAAPRTHHGQLTRKPTRGAARSGRPQGNTRKKISKKRPEVNRP